MSRHVGGQVTVEGKRRTPKGLAWAVADRRGVGALGGFAGGVVLLHLLGWGCSFYFARSNPALAGSARSPTRSAQARLRRRPHRGDRQQTRKLLQDESADGCRLLLLARSLHVVLALAAGLALATKTVNSKDPGLSDIGKHHRRLRLGHLP